MPGYPRLIALNTELKGLDYPLVGPETVIGRSAECEILLDQFSVSRQHARFECRDGRYFVHDLGSRNGIKVGNQPVAEAEVHHGDVVTIGDVQLQLDLPGGAVAPARAARVPAAAAPDEPVAAPPSAPGGPVQLNLKLILAIVVGVGAAILIAAGILALTGRSRGVQHLDLDPIKIKVNEKRWVRIEGRRVWLDRDEAELNNFTNIAVADVGVATAERYDEGDLLVTGESVGETDVTLTLTSGKTVGLRVIVRGWQEDPNEWLIYAPFTDEQRRTMAQRFVATGSLAEKDHPYIAGMWYRQALAVLTNVREKGQASLDAEQRIKRVDAEVESRWQALRNQINTTRGDRIRQYQLLQEAVELIPDTNDARNQMAAGRMHALMGQALSEKQRGRRP